MFTTSLSLRNLSKMKSASRMIRSNRVFLSTTVPSADTTSTVSNLASRFAVTAEVAISKLFPAGFGWQAGSVVAGNLGYAATDVPLFLITGVGDALGVGVGHMLYYTIKNALGYKQDLKAQAHTSVFLATACLFSGTGWQPVVNFLHNTAHLDFNGAAFGTMTACGLLFFTGLRVSRALWSPVLSGVAPASHDNFKTDAQLSVAVGGASGAFVGTDISFVTDGIDSNWLRPLVGVEAHMTPLQGMVTAGTSTALGFAAVQAVENVAIPAKKCWVD